MLHDRLDDTNVRVVTRYPVLRVLKCLPLTDIRPNMLWFSHGRRSTPRPFSPSDSFVSSVFSTSPTVGNVCMSACAQSSRLRECPRTRCREQNTTSKTGRNTYLYYNLA
jgi:hypothetical protein